MNQRKLNIWYMLVPVILLILPLTASAQWGQGGPGHGNHPHGMRQNFERNLENLRLLKLLETLELSEEQNDKFIAEFSKFRTSIKNITEVLDSHIDTLAAMIQQEEPDNQEILKRVDMIEKLREDRMIERKKFHDRVVTLLNPIQIGKLVVFEERFERELLKTVRGFRRQHQP